MFKKIKKGIMNMANEISNNIMESNKAKYETIQKGMDIGYDLIKCSGKAIIECIKSLNDPKVRRVVGCILAGTAVGLIVSSYSSNEPLLSIDI